MIRFEVILLIQIERKGIPVMFKDRREAGRRLAELLEEYSGRDDVIVLGLPRGGVPVAWEVAQALKAPLDVFIVRKLGVPGQEELAMGAIASGGVRVMNDEVLNYLDIDQALIDEITAGEQIELEKREKLYRGNRGNRGNRPFPELRGRTVLLVDDGLATGSSMRAAIKALQLYQPAAIVVAVPVAAAQVCDRFNRMGGNITCVCLETPEQFHAVGMWYQDFSQTSDQEVCELLEQDFAI